MLDSMCSFMGQDRVLVRARCSGWNARQFTVECLDRTHTDRPLALRLMTVTSECPYSHSCRELQQRRELTDGAVELFPIIVCGAQSGNLNQDDAGRVVELQLPERVAGSRNPRAEVIGAADEQDPAWNPYDSDEEVMRVPEIPHFPAGAVELAGAAANADAHANAEAAQLPVAAAAIVRNEHRPRYRPAATRDGDVIDLGNDNPFYWSSSDDEGDVPARLAGMSSHPRG